MNRRFFLKGAMSVAAASIVSTTAVAHLLEDYPILYGDGIHDDAPALNALFKGKRIICENQLIEVAQGQTVILRQGTFLISDEIVFEDILGSTIEGCKFITTEDFNSDYMLYIKNSSKITNIDNCFFNNKSAKYLKSFALIGD